jgi:hypothetical protein
MSNVRLIKIARIKVEYCQWQKKSDVGVVQALLQAASLSAIDADSSFFDSTSTTVHTSIPRPAISLHHASRKKWTMLVRSMLAFIRKRG